MSLKYSLLLVLPGLSVTKYRGVRRKFSSLFLLKPRFMLLACAQPLLLALHAPTRINASPTPPTRRSLPLFYLDRVRCAPLPPVRANRRVFDTT